MKEYLGILFSQRILDVKQFKQTPSSHFWNIANDPQLSLIFF